MSKPHFYKAIGGAPWIATACATVRRGWQGVARCERQADVLTSLPFDLQVHPSLWGLHVCACRGSGRGLVWREMASVLDAPVGGAAFVRLSCWNPRT